MSGTSNVGGRGVYEAGDQRNAPASEINERERYKEGKENSHKANDSSTRPLEETNCSYCFSDLDQRTRDLLQTN